MHIYMHILTHTCTAPVVAEVHDCTTACDDPFSAEAMRKRAHADGVVLCTTEDTVNFCHCRYADSHAHARVFVICKKERAYFVSFLWQPQARVTIDYHGMLINAHTG